MPASAASPDVERVAALLRGASDGGDQNASGWRLLTRDRGDLVSQALVVAAAMYAGDRAEEREAAWHDLEVEEKKTPEGLEGIVGLYHGIGRVLAEPEDVARALVPDLFPSGGGDGNGEGNDHSSALAEVWWLIEAVDKLGHVTDQSEYEILHAEYRSRLLAVDARLGERRFLVTGASLSFADVLLFAFAIRIDAVFYELFKASAFLLRDLPNLDLFCRDVFEVPEVYRSTDFDEIKRFYYLREPTVNPKRFIPRGGTPPKLHQPHDRAVRFLLRRDDCDESTEENQVKRRVAGEWVRPQSRQRNWIQPAQATGDAPQYPAEANRYHVYAPFNCPWSHRVMLARAAKGLEDVVGLTVVYFRRHAERGWQFNPRFPGCTEDPHHPDSRFVRDIYESVGSDEKSVPVLYDAKTKTIVSNESAEILRMFDTAFGELAKNKDHELVPEGFQGEIDRLNAIVYSRINNGSYKAGFTDDQAAYDLAFDRYFAAFDYLESLLAQRKWLAGTPDYSEADLRLFPTVYRHDAVYYSRFKLNKARVADYPRLSDWLRRMMEVESIAGSSNLDHCRNGYFGRTGNEIVPAGPTPLGVSSKDVPRHVWLGEPSSDE